MALPENGYLTGAEVLTLIYGAIPMVNANQYMLAKWNKGAILYPDAGFAGHMLLAQCKQESKWNYLAESPTGAKGLWQFTTIAWKDIPRVTNWEMPPLDDRWNKWTSTLQAVAKMGYHLARSGGDWNKALRQYNGAGGSEERNYPIAINKYYNTMYSDGTFATLDTEIGGPQFAFDNRSEFK